MHAAANGDWSRDVTWTSATSFPIDFKSDSSLSPRRSRTRQSRWGCGEIETDDAQSRAELWPLSHHISLVTSAWHGALLLRSTFHKTTTFALYFLIHAVDFACLAMCVEYSVHRKYCKREAKGARQLELIHVHFCC